ADPGSASSSCSSPNCALVPLIKKSASLTPTPVAQSAIPAQKNSVAGGQMANAPADQLPSDITFVRGRQFHRSARHPPVRLASQHVHSEIHWRRPPSDSKPGGR